MKKVSFIIAILLLYSWEIFPQISISTDSSLPDSSAMLDVKSTSKGLLVPRMTAVQRDAIVNPATGLLIFCTDNNKYYTNTGTPSAKNWIMLNSQWITNGTSVYYNSGSVGIGTTVPNSSAKLEVASTSQGFLPPRMTMTQMNAISSPAEGLMVYNTTIHRICFFDGNGWQRSDGFHIGDNYGGGIIFYIDATGQHGLIAAPIDLGTELWGCDGTLIGGTGTTIGTGQANTTAIVGGCSESDFAAKACYDLVLNGYSDWFLPSKGELFEIYQQKNTIGGFSNKIYWSSSEHTAYFVWVQDFSTGIQQSLSKVSDYRIRAIRAF